MDLTKGPYYGWCEMNKNGKNAETWLNVALQLSEKLRKHVREQFL